VQDFLPIGCFSNHLEARLILKQGGKARTHYTVIIRDKDPGCQQAPPQ
jgi:hypothetical protein